MIPSRTQGLTVSRSLETLPRPAFDTLQWALHALASLCGLLLLSPVIVLIAITIRLTGGGTVLYRGARVGRNRNVFRIYKFRTLRPGAEAEIGARLLTPEERDAYSTRFGRFLKRSKLDELPQLINVMRGDMRLVGPRPLRPVFLERFEAEIPGYGGRFAVPPGMTGIAQIRGGYYTSPRDKLRYDLRYVRNRSLWLDLWLVLLTFVKILDRWLQTGLLALFLLLFVSFVPPEQRAALAVHAGGLSIDPILVFILFAAALTVSSHDIRHFRFHRGPLNLGLALFLIVGLTSTLLSANPAGSLRCLAYYSITGFLVSFVIVNSLGTEGFSTLTMRAIALTSVAMSLFGLGEIALRNGSVMAVASAPAGAEGVRMASLIGNPAWLSVYLLLGIPLLFAEVSRAQTRREHDFWLVCATVSVVGVVFTQTRFGLLGLLATGALFLARRPRQAVAFLGLFLAGYLILAVSGAPRFVPTGIVAEATAWLDREGRELVRVPGREWLIGGGTGTGSWLAPPPASLAPSAAPRKLPGIPNMHLTLARELGLGAWLVVMGFVVGVLRRMLRAWSRSADESQRTRLWAIFSAIVGFLIAMNGMNAFQNLTLQVYFWSLLGIGLGIANHADPAAGRNLIWRFGDAGDG